jgi:hypothetical protein
MAADQKAFKSRQPIPVEEKASTGLKSLGRRPTTAA